MRLLNYTLVGASIKSLYGGAEELEAFWLLAGFKRGLISRIVVSAWTRVSLVFFLEDVNFCLIISVIYLVLAHSGRCGWASQMGLYALLRLDKAPADCGVWTISLLSGNHTHHASSSSGSGSVHIGFKHTCNGLIQPSHSSSNLILTRSWRHSLANLNFFVFFLFGYSGLFPLNHTGYISVNYVWSFAKIIVSGAYFIITLASKTNQVWLLLDKLASIIFLISVYSQVTWNRRWVYDSRATSLIVLFSHVHFYGYGRSLLHNLKQISCLVIVSSRSRQLRLFPELSVVKSLLFGDKARTFLYDFYADFFNTLFSEMLNLVHLLVNAIKALGHLILSRTWSILILLLYHLYLKTSVFFDGLVVIWQIWSRWGMWDYSHLTCAPDRNRFISKSKLLLTIDIATITVNHCLKGLFYWDCFYFILSLQSF